MAAPGDSIDPTDDALFQIGSGRAADDFPAGLLCPSGHQAERLIVTLAGSDNPVRVPVYLCEACTTVYRYPECRLAPGDEGAA
jgi:hypothetical protein